MTVLLMFQEVSIEHQYRDVAACAVRHRGGILYGLR